MGTFTPRLSSEGMYQHKYWYSENPFHQSGYGLPNCTCYAWGRFYEVSGARPSNLSLGDAGDWFDYNQAGGWYEYGLVPRLGAIACWSEPGEAGHVAVVEQVNNDGSFVVSQSGYYRPVASYPPDTKNYFWTSTCDADTKTPSGNSTYVFQGFIYSPQIVDPDTPREWISKNTYLTLTEMKNNAVMAWDYFGSRGWTLNAVAAMLGNMQTESTINPGIWESLESDYESYFDAHGRYPGYGLVQWTPFTKYSNWAGARWQNNGDKQCERIIYERDNGLQWFENPAVDIPVPPITFAEFSTSTLPVSTLANYFLWYYEHPQNPNQPNRAKQALEWYDYLSGITPRPPTPPSPSTRKKHRTSKVKWMYYLSRK